MLKNQVGKSPVISRYCPHCGGKWQTANVWRESSQDFVLPETITNCCPFLKGSSKYI